MGYIEDLEEELKENTEIIDALCKYLGVEIVSKSRTLEETRELYKTDRSVQMYYKEAVKKED